MAQQTDELAATAHDGADEPDERVTNKPLVMKEACDTDISLRWNRGFHRVTS